MDTTNSVLRVGLPKGRMQTKVVQLLADAGLPVSIEEREYRPRLGNGFSLKTQAGQLSYETKLLKPQNIVEMLSSGSRDVGFAGADWVRELKADLVELLDTGMDPVSVVVAAPERLVKLIGEAGTPRTPWNKACGRNPIVASEYESLAREWMAEKLPEGVFIRSYGATEVFPPEDADIIIDNCATGSTLKANGLVIMETVMKSSTRLYASRQAMENPAKKEAAEALVLILRSVMEARRRVMLEMNVEESKLENLIAILPCLRSPTLSPLEGGKAYAVRVAAPKDQLAALIPEIKRRGGTDILVIQLGQLVP
ncbi:MAG: ATP phosphoribosyltransferase [Spirochaetia bacterium]|jgi:ATP phosphoribosyltransferase|uniref:ATP phosphoribosyltransferase n=1 Tax=bioreactor metagenome TaxID=1076179 RepID=A0A644TG04_9ZZZZ|nr:ATP phosphoribosyltransferase [Spirochaetia bacterium]NLX44890.1 ATP phosphoribosyltransferase [Treponema sp.]VBB40517.1 ATP phosphoribosyltransferase [uncultured Spirochaetota bacterium]HAP55814.1 ATP phosphoribosyltransferase [Spirochaetaceae bacterium]HOI22806.1 ATP phosphoribosyltransferase [Spirochaetales bacterium]